MTDPQPQSKPVRPNSRFTWVVVVLILVVLVLASLELGLSNPEPSPTATVTEDIIKSTQTSTVLASNPATETIPPDVPPSPDEIGYTDGIIFLATILVLILLVGTLREIVHRKGV